ncbi:relaxase/mobilization nuclease domain-containing protein, partial [Aeromonas caviae]
MSGRNWRTDIGKPVWHCSLSLPPGERLSAEKWEAVTADFMQRMG